MGKWQGWEDGTIKRKNAGKGEGWSVGLAYALPLLGF